MNNTQAARKDPQELREYHRLKVAVCRANKVQTIKNLQDAINTHRAKLNLPRKKFPTAKSSQSMKGRAMPKYEPPPEMRKHMTNSEISAWKAAERRKRKNVRNHLKKAQEDEQIRSLQNELRGLVHQVGELGKPMSVENKLPCTYSHIKVRDAQEKKRCGIQDLLQAAIDVDGSFDAPKGRAKSTTGLLYTKTPREDRQDKVVICKGKEVCGFKELEKEAAIDSNCETPWEQQRSKVKEVQEKKECRIEDLEAAISFNRAKLGILEQIVQELKENAMKKKKKEKVVGF